MPARKAPDPQHVRDAVAAVADYIHHADTGHERPPRADLAAAVRATAAVAAATAPGRAVEVRIPPFAAVQCIGGPTHTRGTPPNVVETDPLTWLRLATGHSQWADCVANGSVTASGNRAADVAELLPLARLGS